MTDEPFLQELHRTLRGPLISKEAKAAIQQIIEAEYACGSRVVAAALAYLLNTEDRHRKAISKLDDAMIKAAQVKP